MNLPSVRPIFVVQDSILKATNLAQSLAYRVAEMLRQFCDEFFDVDRGLWFKAKMNVPSAAVKGFTTIKHVGTCIRKENQLNRPSFCSFRIEGTTSCRNWSR